MPVSSCSAIIVAAGKSQRFQTDTRPHSLPASVDLFASQGNRSTNLKKPFIRLLDDPVWMHSARQFQAHPAVQQLLLVIAEEDFDWVSSTFRRFIKDGSWELIIGGTERADSVENALLRVNSNCDLVLIHDAARPCIGRDLIDRVLDQAQLIGAAIPAVPVHSTLKRSADGHVVSETVDRNQLYLAQTPQVFRRDWIQTAYSQRAGQVVTDEAQLLEQLGYPVALVPGSPWNLKITVPEDLRMAETWMQMSRS